MSPWPAIRWRLQNLPLLAEIKGHGFDGVEVPLFRSADFATREIRQGLEQNGLECTICSVLPRPLSMISDDELPNRAFQLAYFLHRERKTAVEIATRALNKLQLAATAQGKRPSLVGIRIYHGDLQFTSVGLAAEAIAGGWATLYTSS